MKDIKLNFAIIGDSRHKSYVKHELQDILTIIMCAVLCGLGELCEICEYVKNKSEFLRKRFNIKSIPSKPTFCRVLNMINGEKAAEIIIEIMRKNVLEIEKLLRLTEKLYAVQKEMENDE